MFDIRSPDYVPNVVGFFALLMVLVGVPMAFIGAYAVHLIFG